MPLARFTEDYKPKTFETFPKLKLTKNEKARIICLEDPTYEYVHTIRAPKLENGEPVSKDEERKDGSVQVKYVMDFISRPLCLGDEGIIRDKGLDAKNCPVCAEAKISDTVDKPQKRFAMNVVQYATKSGTFEPRKPFAVDNVVWSFTENVFSKLYDIVEEHGDLKNVDLLLGPCEVEQFQKFDINPGGKTCVYLLSDKTKEITLETYKENRHVDLSSACGMRKDRRGLENDLETVRYRWAKVNGAVRAENTDLGEEEISSLSEDLGKLMEESNTDNKDAETDFSVFSADDKAESSENGNSSSVESSDDWESMIKDLDL